ncbi:tRNA pseudouridine(55) synthase TruB [Candidatus Nitrosacidococcus sp. I8]|uniref:tRNA pseudouridine(55) synthase TruB n=1 Tax=Candidatus Nitrosacidococcus sp. I8 TaxID=2942908 RepID=UPI0022272636|nr:tRNA pseudouridine(55) synthase TruB [Candidatus Nitrosacidococcus sp. I8]CAH9017843.1 tRNA pseudouridine synthase B [Candidatus Nitrosacidococcus sp. I8]
MEKQNQLKSHSIIHGMVLLDKPIGMSSNAALQQVKRIYQVRKAGHTGSLDPMASGLLPICLGEATKLSQFILDADKRYLVRCRLGVTTTTGDAEGEIIKTTPVKTFDWEFIENTLKRFIGAQEQIPPMYSAIKYHGQPLYKLARQGIEIKRSPRKIIIYNIKLTEATETYLSLEVFCSKGTYIRTLVEDIGHALECGAHTTMLRRIQVGNFNSVDMISLSQLKDLAEMDNQLNTLVLPPRDILKNLPEVSIIPHLAHCLRQGQTVFISQLIPQGLVRLVEDNKDFFGIGKAVNSNQVAPYRLLFTSNG